MKLFNAWVIPCCLWALACGGAEPSEEGDVEQNAEMNGEDPSGSAAPTPSDPVPGTEDPTLPEEPETMDPAPLADPVIDDPAPSLAGSCEAEFIGAFADAVDFSANSETGIHDLHQLLMNDGSMIRQVTMYTTEGEADHQHEVSFTLEQLGTLLDGGSVTVETSGALNARVARGHTHTVTVHACAQPVRR